MKSTTADQADMLHGLFSTVRQMISNLDLSASTFRQYLLANKSTCNFYDFLTPGSLNILQLVVKYNRVDFLATLFDLGFWKKMSADVVKLHTFKGLTALQMSQKLNSVKMFEKLNMFNHIEQSLHPLELAAREGNEKTVESILSQVDTIFSPNLENKALYYATIAGNWNIIQTLVKNGWDIACYKGDDNLNLLLQATYLNHDNLIIKLIRELEFNPNQTLVRNGTEISLLQIAAMCGNWSSFEALIKGGAILQKDILVSACLSENTMFFCEIMKKYGLDINESDIYGRRPIHMVVLYGKYSMFQLLESKRAYMYAKDIFNRNILHFACKGGNKDILHALLNFSSLFAEGKKNIQVMINSQAFYKSTDNILFVTGSRNGRNAWYFIHVHRHLLKRFHTIKKKSGEMNMSEFGSVVKTGWGSYPSENAITEIRQKFNASFLNAGHILEKDLTPLMQAILASNYQLVPILLKFAPHINLSIKDAFGFTALDHACMKGHLYTVKILISAGEYTLGITELRQSIGMAKENEHHVVSRFLERILYSKQVQKFIKLLVENVKLGIDHMKSMHIRGEDMTPHCISMLRECIDHMTNFKNETVSMS